MWHLCPFSSRPLISACHALIRQRPLVSIKPSTPQRLFSFPSAFKKKPSATLPQPPVNPRHPPDYVPPRSSSNTSSSSTVHSQSSIFARFRHAYAKYGKILIYVHFFSSCGWFSGLLVLHFNGFDLGLHLINGLARFHIISEEQRGSFIRHMNEYSLSGLINKLPLISSEYRERLSRYWTGERVRILATAVLLYKFLMPIRYAFTLGVTTYISRVFLKRGIIQRAPKGDSLQELYRDQKQLIKSHVRRAREKMKSSTTVRRGSQKPE